MSRAALAAAMASRAAGGNVGVVGVGAGDREEAVEDEDAPVPGLVVVAETLCDTPAVVVTASELAPLEDDVVLEAVECDCVCSGRWESDESDSEVDPLEEIRGDAVDVVALVVRLATAVPLEDAEVVEFDASSDEAIDCEMDELDAMSEYEVRAGEEVDPDEGGKALEEVLTFVGSP